MERISVEDVEHIAFHLARELLTFNEPIPDFNTRYPNVLESCLLTPLQAFGKQDCYQGFIAKTSILFYLMIKNHPFQNGNKRIAVTTLFYALSIKEKWLKITNQELLNFAVFVAGSPANSKKQMVKYIEEVIEKNIIPYPEDKDNPRD